MKGFLYFIILLLLGAMCPKKLIAQSVVFNNVYNDFSHTFNYSSTDTIYNNESIYAITQGSESYFLSGHSFTNYAISSDSQILTLFNMKIDVWGDTIWQKRDDISISGTEGIGNYYEYSNKDLLSFGTISDSFYTNFETQDGLVYKMDSLGNELWRRRYNFGDDTHFTSKANTKNNGQSFQVLGFADVDTIGVNYDAFISTIDSSGNLISNIQLGGAANDFLYGLEYLDNGNYLVCGHTFSQGAGISDIWLLEIDTIGNIIWEKTYGGAVFDRIENARGLLIHDNHIYIAGRSSYGSTAGYLIKTDMQGNLVWEKKFVKGYTVDKFVSLSLWDNESFIVCGQTYSYGAANERPIGWLLKIDTAGNMIWEREVAKYKNIYADHYVYDGMITSDGGILIGGYIIANSVVDINGYYHRNDAWLAKTDSCGFTVGDVPEPMLLIDSIYNSTVYLSEQSTNYCTGVIDWGDGTAYFYSAYENNKPLSNKNISHTYNEIDNYTIRTTAVAGEETRDFEVQVLGLSVSGTVIPAQAGISLFPNPANDYVIVQNTNSTVIKSNSTVIPAQAGISMNIFNLNGKQVKSIGLNDKLYQQKIDVSALNNGVYFVKFMLGDLLIGTEKMVIAR